MKNKLLEDLSDSVNNNDFRFFRDQLEESFSSLSQISNQTHENIFHDFPKSVQPEKFIINFIIKASEVVKEKFGLQSLVKLLSSSSTQNDCMTPLHVAISQGRRVSPKQKISKKYLELGADPKIKSDSGQNALHYSAKFSQFSILLHLVNIFNMNLHSVDHQGNNCLQLAIKSNHEEMALLIISINLCDKRPDERKAQTLGMAVRAGSYRITKHLLVHTRYESFEIVQSSKKCENKDIEKLLVKDI